MGKKVGNRNDRFGWQGCITLFLYYIVLLSIVIDICIVYYNTNTSFV